MTFEEATDMMELYSISPTLTCTCDEFHTCQQCQVEMDAMTEALLDEKRDIAARLEAIHFKYGLKYGSQLVMHQHGTNGVDCWFDSGNFRQHRCLSQEDFEFVKEHQ